jgi:hypothetical protein
MIFGSDNVGIRSHCIVTFCMMLLISIVSKLGIKNHSHLTIHKKKDFELFLLSAGKSEKNLAVNTFYQHSYVV